MILLQAEQGRAGAGKGAGGGEATYY